MLAYPLYCQTTNLFIMKRFMRYCTIVCPVRTSVVSYGREASMFLGYDGPVVFFGSKDRMSQYLKDEMGNVRHFHSVMDAVNYLSQNFGYHLVQTFKGSSNEEFWEMAREEQDV